MFYIAAVLYCGNVIHVLAASIQSLLVETRGEWYPNACFVLTIYRWINLGQSEALEGQGG